MNELAPPPAARTAAPGLLRRLFKVALWTCAGLLTALCGAKLFLGDVYHVESSSMEPTIHGCDGGEWILVRYSSAPPPRGEIVVARVEREPAPVVKRVLGLPHERVQVAGGDVIVDGRVVPAAEARTPLITAFDQRRDDVARRFVLRPAPAGPWSQQAGAWRVAGSGLAARDDAGLARYAERLDDSYPEPDGSRAAGETGANDAELEVELWAEAAQGTARFLLSERGDRFELALSFAAGARATAVISRSSAGAAWSELARAEFPCAPATWLRVRFSNRDDELCAVLAGLPAAANPLCVRYARNEFHPGDQQRQGLHIGARAEFGGDGGDFRFRGLVLRRDVVYTARGERGTQAVCELGMDEYFLLGDNSARSRDSREWGPVRREALLGRATHVVWPPGRWRSLGAR